MAVCIQACIECHYSGLCELGGLRIDEVIQLFSLAYKRVSYARLTLNEALRWTEGSTENGDYWEGTYI